MLARSRAWFGLLSVLAVIAPAAGLATLGMQSNLVERDRARQAFVAGNQKEARFLAAAVDGAAARALDGLLPLFDEGGVLAGRAEVVRTAQAAAGLDQAFFIDAEGRVRWPPSLGAASPLPPRTLTERAPSELGFSGYLADLRARQQRARLLAIAAAAEAAGRRSEARRTYADLAAGDDAIAARALVALARLALASDAMAEAGEHYAALGRRFGDELDDEGLSYGLVAAAGRVRAQRDPQELLGFYRDLVEDRWVAPSSAIAALVRDTRARLAPASDSALAAEVEVVDVRAAVRQREAEFAARLVPAAEGLLGAATGEAQTRRMDQPDEALWLFRRHAGGVLGVALAPSAIDALAGRALAGEVTAGNLPAGTVVRLTSAPPDPAAPGTLAIERLPLLSPLHLALVGDAGAADRVARAQLVRYLALVGSLILVMAAGMVALWRGVRRERELARLKSDFVSTVSHELKTPLTSIRMFGEMLREGVGQGDAERERRYHEVIVRESERLGRLIANVLDFAQIEKGARTYDRRAVSAPMLAGEAVDTFRRLADGEGQEIALAVLPQAGSAQVLADREAIVQALLNLLSNAAKYGARRPVSVSVGADAENVRIAVADHGPGLASGEQERVFREFYRAPEARRSGVEGTGLGLALVKRHVEAHGGRIEVESAPGQGATFTIVLPRAMEQVA